MELRHEFDLEVLLSQTNMARSSFYYQSQIFLEVCRWHALVVLSKIICFDE